MSKKGGYLIIDFKDNPITVGTPFAMDGVYERLERANKKTVLLSGLSIGGEKKRDVFVDMIRKTVAGSSSYVALFDQYEFLLKSYGSTPATISLVTDPYAKIVKFKRDTYTLSVQQKTILAGATLSLTFNADTITGSQSDINKYIVLGNIATRYSTIFSYEVEGGITYRGSLAPYITIRITNKTEESQEYPANTIDYNIMVISN